MKKITLFIVLALICSTVFSTAYHSGTISCSSTGWRGIDAGGNLKETGTTHWNSPNTGATNSSGFIGLPGGCRSNGGFNNTGYYGYFWSSSGSGSEAWSRLLYYHFAQDYRDHLPQDYGFSVRCLKD